MVTSLEFAQQAARLEEDACFFVKAHQPNPRCAFLLEFLLGFLGFAQTPPPQALLEAVREELEDLCARATTALQALDVGADEKRARDEALRILASALGSSRDAAKPTSAYFPREALRAVAAPIRELGGPLGRELTAWVERHEAFEARLRWLVQGTTPEQAETLDPRRDCDRIYHYLSSEFRAADRIIDLVSINRISQSASVALFFHGTREGELNPVYRLFDTFLVFANFIEWGWDSKRGRACTEVMNRIHGRYYIPNAGMKYVLLQLAFTWIDAVARIGHRPLRETEKQGYMHAFVGMGRTMHIQELSDDYEEMLGWYRAFNAANAANLPLKTYMFQTIVENSLKGLASPELQAAALFAARVAMEDTYRQSIGYPAPTPDEIEAVRSVFRTARYLLAFLPKQPWIRSLQETPVRRAGHAVEELGVRERSPHMPAVWPGAPNGGYPVLQRPVATESDLAKLKLPLLSWEEVRQHASAESLWVVIDEEVYDVTQWARRHPGGFEVLRAHGGRDASRAYHEAKHSAATEVFKLNHRIGRVRGPDPERARLGSASKEIE